MTQSFIINYKSKKSEIERSIYYLKTLGIATTDYETRLQDIVSTCQKELDKENAKPKNAFTDSSLDFIYSKYLKELKKLNHEISYYNKFIKIFDFSKFVVQEDKTNNITQKNINIFSSDAIKLLELLLRDWNFNDSNSMVLFQKIVPAYLILMKKELFYNEHSHLIDYIEKVGLSELFLSAKDSNLKFNSLEEYITNEPDFIKNVLECLQAKYKTIEETFQEREDIETQLSKQNTERKKWTNQKTQAGLSRLIACGTALIVLTSSLIYGINKGIKSLATTHLYNTTKTTYSTLDGKEKTTQSYEEKIPSGEKILVVSYTPWEEYMKNEFTRTIVSADVSDIDYAKLEDYLNINLANLNNVNVKQVNASNLSATEIYERQITEVIKLIQNHNDSIADTDNFLYKYSLQIVLISLLIAYVLVKTSMLFAGITDSLVADIAYGIYSNIKTKKNCNKLLAELDKDMQKLLDEYNKKADDIDELIVNFRTIYEKYRYLISSPTLINVYDNLVRRKGN